jgi:hypothetical protein
MLDGLRHVAVGRLFVALLHLLLGSERMAGSPPAAVASSTAIRARARSAATSESMTRPRRQGG